MQLQFRFNSTLVQLKVFNNEAQLVGHVRFNSTLVQLKANFN